MIVLFVFSCSCKFKLISLLYQSKQIFLKMGCGSSTEVEKCEFDEENKVIHFTKKIITYLNKLK